jgi:hypothetical protein
VSCELKPPRRGPQIRITADVRAMMQAQLAAQAATIREAEVVLGYSYDDEIDRVPFEPPWFGQITARDVVEAGRLGYRGREAVRVAASWHRRDRVAPQTASKTQGSRTTRATQRPREHRRSAARAGSRASPGDEPPEPPVDAGRRCLACGADIEHRRPQAKTCGGRCRVRKHRGWPGGFEDAEQALVELIGRGETRAEDALLRLVQAWSQVAA